MTDNYAGLVERLHDRAMVAGVRLHNEAAAAITALVKERDAMKNLLLVMVTTAESWMSTPEAKLMLVNGAIDAVNTQNRIDQIRAVLSEGNIND